MLLDISKPLVELLERAKRPGVLGAKGKSIEVTCRKDLKAYFLDLKKRVEALDLGNLADQTVELARHGAEMRLANVLRITSSNLTAILSLNIYHAFVAAATQDVLHQLGMTNRQRAKYHLAKLKEDFNPDEDRDEKGMWTAGGGSAAAPKMTPAQKKVLGKLKADPKNRIVWDSTPHVDRIDGEQTTRGDDTSASVVLGLLKGGHIEKEGGGGSAGYAIYKLKVKESMSEADQASLFSLDKLGLTGQDAADYAAEKSAQLVTGVNDTTRQKIADAVANGIEERLGPAGLARKIRDLLGEWTLSRAEMIASTEMNDAMSEASLRKMRSLSIGYKQIILSDDACEVCEENADADPLPIDEPYPSGDLRAPFHPNCRCATTGARPPEDEGD